MTASNPISPAHVLPAGGATRRALLARLGALAGAVPAAGLPLATGLLAGSEAAAQTAGDYRALVCLFLAGGNDSFNTVLATDSTAWSAYQQVRQQLPDSLALMAAGTLPDTVTGATIPQRLGGVRPLSLPGRSLALHPALGRLVTLHGQGRLALLANVGPLLQPTTKVQYASAGHPKPPKLFSHNDQQNLWQALSPEGAASGWGGRIADLMLSGNGSQAMFTAISANGAAVWLSGRTARPYQVSAGGAIRIGNGVNLYGSRAAYAAMQKIVRGEASTGGARSAHLLERDHADVVARSIDAEATLATQLGSAGTAPWGTPPSGTGSYNPATDPLLAYTDPLSGASTFNPLAQQLQMVARSIAARSALGLRRQVFFVSLSGFDTHNDQNRAHTTLMARLDHALSYFDSVLVALGASQQVTTFTASDFGRSFTSNGDGTDHGWGAHHFITGGAVRAGLYGRWPTLGVKNTADNGFDSSADQIRNGALLPTTSVDQYGATLGAWMGVPSGELLTIFPSLGNFDAGVRNLGFLA